MKYLLILLLSFSAHAKFKLEISVSPNAQGGQSKIFNNQNQALQAAIKIAKMKRGWRKGRIDQVATDALYNFVEPVCITQPTGNMIDVPEYDVDGNEIGTVSIEEFEEVCTDTTFYYHPVNWVYTITDVTAEEQAKEDAKQQKKQVRNQLRNIRTKLRNNENINANERRKLYLYILNQLSEDNE